jgi:hypothetical protein
MTRSMWTEEEMRKLDLIEEQFIRAGCPEWGARFRAEEELERRIDRREERLLAKEHVDE